MRFRAVPIAWLLALSACAGVAAQADKPAVIVNPTGESRAELLGAIRSALGNVPVALADDALTHDNLLVVERMPRRDAGGRLLNGRVLDKPERFILVRRGSQCLLIQENTRHEWPLKHVECAAK